MPSASRGHHFVWIPFKRHKIFRDEAIMEATKRYIREAVANNGIEIEAIAINCILKDHVHVFTSFPPRLSASEVVNILKGYSSRHLRMEFPWLKQLYNDLLTAVLADIDADFNALIDVFWTK